MKHKIISVFFLFWLLFFCYSNAYLLWFKSRDNTIENIIRIEDEYAMKLSIVSFIFDPRSDKVWQALSNLNSKLWEDRIYHISISPNNFSAKEVWNGLFDNEYKKFFELIKENNLKVVFRTMHEMNGGRYPRSSNPYYFKKAWIHVRELSREAGLTTNNILFDMSLNAWDLPAKDGKVWQKSTFIQCQQAEKQKTGCPTFEDYYPWDKYVDLLGVTFYNRWKWNSNRRRWTPREIVNAKWRNTLDRMKKFWKPIFIDEVWTTAVNYTWAYNYKKSLEVFASNKDMKNKWLLQLRDFFVQETSIVGANYFNVDLTNWLQNWTLWELDRSVIDFRTNKFYESIIDIYNSADKLKNNNSVLMSMFDVNLISLNWKNIFVRSAYTKPIKDISLLLDKQYSGNQQKLTAIDNMYLKWWLKSKYKRFNEKQLKEIYVLVKWFYSEKEKISKTKR